MLGGMFKRKDKKSKGQEKENEDNEKTSSDLSRQSQEGAETSISDAQGAKISQQPHRQTSKLQKQLPAKLSPKSSYQQQKEVQTSKTNLAQSGAGAPELELNRAPTSSDDSDGLPKALNANSHGQAPHDSPIRSRSHSQDTSIRERSPSGSSKERDQGDLGSVKAPILIPAGSEASPNADRRLKTRPDETQMSSQVNELTRTTTVSSHGSQTESISQQASTAEQHHLSIAQAAQYETYDSHGRDILSIQHPEHSMSHPVPSELHKGESFPPERITPHQPPPLDIETSSAEEPSHDYPRSSSSTPELVERPYKALQQSKSDTSTAKATAPIDESRMSTDEEEDQEQTKVSTNTPTESTPSKRSEREATAGPTTPSSASSTTTPTAVWSDASLRAYLDSDSTDIQELLLVVHDKTGVVPRRDHPVVRNMYREENRRLDELSANLDGLLNQYLSRKNPSRKGGTTGGVPVRT